MLTGSIIIPIKRAARKNLHTNANLKFDCVKVSTQLLIDELKAAVPEMDELEYRDKSKLIAHLNNQDLKHDIQHKTRAFQKQRVLLRYDSID